MFIESPRFPEEIAYGASGGPTFSTTITQVLSGSTKAIRSWKEPLHRFEVSHGVRDQAQLDVLLNFFWNCGGVADQFRFKNFADFKISNTNCAFNEIDGLYKGTSTFKIFKVRQLTAMIKSYSRIFKPVPGTFKLYNAGVEVSPANYLVDYTTGKVSITTATSTSTITAITKASAGVVTTSVAHNLNTNDIIEFSGVVEMTEINGQSATVSVLTTTTFQVNINTSAYTAYVSGGQVKKYLNSGAGITFTCEFDLPCRFGKDDMKINIDNYEIYSWNQIPINEVRLEEIL